MRALRLLLALPALVAAAPALAQRFTAITLVPFGSDDAQAIGIQLDSTVIQAPRTEKHQHGFADTRLSADGRYAGWVPTEPNCCASYPVKLRLVVIDTQQHLHRFDSDSSLWDWGFVESREAVALLSAPMHAPSWFVFDLRSIKSGKLLAHYECPTLVAQLPTGYQRPPMPDWAHGIAPRAECDEWDKERAEEQP